MRNTTFVLLALASVLFAEPAVLMESDNDTVVKVKYMGSGTDDAPILSVTGDKYYGAIIEGTSRALTGRVPGYDMPYPAIASGMAAAGPLGIAALGTGNGCHVIGGHVMSTSSNGE